MSTATSHYIHLRNRSAYSLSRGAIKINKLLDFCLQDNMPAIAISDFDNLFGAMEFSLSAISQGIQPIIGCDMYLAYHTIEKNYYTAQQNIGARVLLLVMNAQGYRNINKLNALAYMRDDEDMHSEQTFITLKELKEYHEGLILLTGGMDGLLAQTIIHNQITAGAEILTTLHDIFDNRLYIELQRLGQAYEKKIENQLLKYAHDFTIPYVATNDCYYIHQDDFDAHDAMLCIHGNHLLTDHDRPRVTRENWLKPASDMCQLFADLPTALENSVEIAKRCHFLLEEKPALLPTYRTENTVDDKNISEADILRDLSYQGLEKRLSHYHNMPSSDRQNYDERLEYELDVIIKMGFAGYFLIVADFIQWSKQQHISVGPGRGSGAGSLVAWALTITDLDPISFGLLFERFLNPERVSMPDFDIDFCQNRRDEVIDYVQQKYGSNHVAQIITIGTFKARQILRDIGRVLQLSLGMVDRICKMVPNNPTNPLTLQQALDSEEILKQEYDNNQDVKRMIDMALKLEGLYRHASTHAAGIVISRDRLDETLPVYRDRRTTIPVTQYNMKYVEKTGLVKFDLLGLKTLTLIQNTVDIINTQLDDAIIKKQKDSIDISLIDLQDKETYALYCQANTVGIFQVESVGMQDVLKSLRPDRLEDMIAVVALYRPGPMDNIPSFIKRKHGQEDIKYLHPLLEKTLQETYGIAVYQEQVIEMARILAGYSLGGADLLRRAMGKKIKQEMDAQRKNFIDGAAEHNNIPEQQASEIFEQISAFAGYGFNKSHAAAYALVSYQTAWLKAHYPVAFYCASMSLDMNSPDKLAIFTRDAIKNNIKILPPCINQSMASFAPAKANGEFNAIHYGLAAIRNTGIKAMEDIITVREKDGIFQDIFDFVCRVDLYIMNKRILENLICAGAFDTIHHNRRQLFDSIDILITYAQEQAQNRQSGQSSFFGNDMLDDQLPILAICDNWSKDIMLEQEMKSIGFFLTDHPLSNYTKYLESQSIVSSNQIDQLSSRKKAHIIKIAGISTGLRQIRTRTGKKVAFLTLNDQFGQYDVTVYDENISQWRELFAQRQPLLINVAAQYNDKDNSWRLIAQKVAIIGKDNHTVAKDYEIKTDGDCDIIALANLLKNHAKKSNNKIESSIILLRLCQRSYGDVILKIADGLDIHDDFIKAVKMIHGVNNIYEIDIQKYQSIPYQQNQKDYGQAA